MFANIQLDEPRWMPGAVDPDLEMREESSLLVPPEQTRLRPWWVFLSQLRLAVHYIEGLKNELRDYLSRNSFDERLGQS